MCWRVCCSVCVREVVVCGTMKCRYVYNTRVVCEYVWECVCVLECVWNVFGGVLEYVCVGGCVLECVLDCEL